MPEYFALRNALGLKPKEAIEYFKSKGYTFSWDWTDTLQESHTKAFTVAKALRMDVLQDIRGEVQKALDEGITFQEFKKNLEPRLKAKGWWGKKMVGDGQGGQVVQLGSPRRLKTIYMTNLQTSYMAGKYKDFTANIDNQPYWMYVAKLDQKTRPTHAALNGMVFKHDDPFWDTHFPPNDWGCRCRARPLSEERYQNKLAAGEAFKGKGDLNTKEVTLKDGQKVNVTEFSFKTPTGIQKMTPGAGWNYNPGKAWQKPFTPAPYDPSIHGEFKTVGAQFHKKTPIDGMASKPLTREMLLSPHQKTGWGEERYINEFLGEFGAGIGKPVIYRDVVNDPVVISEELFRDRQKGGYKVVKADREVYLKMLADTIKDPAEVWMIWKQGKDKLRLCKRYIGMYKGEQGRIGGFAVFDLIDDVWQGTTIYKPDTLKQLDDYREGTLLYTKK